MAGTRLSPWRDCIVPGIANAHRGKVRKAILAAAPLRIVEEELRRVPSRGWAA